MKQDGSKTEKLIELSDLPTEILDHVAFFLQRIDRNAVLSMSQTSSAMFAGAKHHRSKILLPGLLRRAGIDGENMLKSFDLHQDAIPLDSALLEASIERFGYTMVLLVNDLLERISQVPLMRNPTYIREARELLKRWKNHLFQHCGALGFFLAISYEYNNLTRSGTSGITHYPDHALKVLRYTYAFRYLLENHYGEQSILRHFVRVCEYEPSESKSDIIQKKRGKLVIHEKNFKAIEDEITENLPLTGHLAKYQTVKILRLNVKEEAFKELQALQLVEQDTPNPYLYF